MVNNVPDLSYVLWRFCSFYVVALGLFGRLPRYFFAYSTVHSTIPLWDLALSSSAVFLSNARHIIQRNRVLAAGGAVLSTSLSGSLSPHPARGSFFIAGCTCSAAADHGLEGAAMRVERHAGRGGPALSRK